MKPKGEEISSAIRDWMKEEIKKGPSYIYELGRFFFTVSSSTVAFQLAMERFPASATLHWLSKTSAALFFLSILIALKMVTPTSYKLDGDVDYYEIYSRHLNRLVRLSYAWSATWFAGVLVWILKLFKNP